MLNLADLRPVVTQLRQLDQLDADELASAIGSALGGRVTSPAESTAQLLRLACLFLLLWRIERRQDHVETVPLCRRVDLRRVN